MDEQIHKITSRHIARLLSKLEGSITNLVEQEIKREMRFLEEDMKILVNTRASNEKENLNQ